MLPDNQAKKGVSGNFQYLLLSKVMTILVKRMHVINSQLRVKNKSDKYSKFPDTVFRERCQEDIAMLIASSRSNPTGNELD